MGVVVLSCALIALWRLPLGSVTSGFETGSTSEELRYSALRRELTDAQALLDQVQRAATLPELIDSAADGGVSVVVPDRFVVAPETETRLREVVRAEARDLGAREPDFVVGYAYDGDSGTGLPISRGQRVETYLFEHDGRKHCLQVAVTRPGMVDEMVEQDLDGTGWSRRTGSLLGSCAFYGKYGSAGPLIQEWLEAGGIEFALGRGHASADVYPQRARRRTFTAMRLMADFGGAMENERCLTGEAATCTKIFLDPDGVNPVGARRQRVAQRSPAIYSGYLPTDAFSYDGPFLLADLEARFGPEAFRRFWTSGDEVTAAFETAFGMEVGDWIVEWLDERTGIDKATPAPTLAATFGSLLLVSLMTGLAAFVHRRRRVA
jgi:hypothetical protein